MAKVNKWIKVGAGHYEFMHDRNLVIKKIKPGREEEYEGLVIGDKWEAKEGTDYLDSSERLGDLKDFVEMKYDKRIEEEVIE